MDLHLKCARANWRPPISSHHPVCCPRSGWLSANCRRHERPVHLFHLFHCLSISLLLVVLPLVCSVSADRAELAPAKVEKSSLVVETYNLARRAQKREEESLLPTRSSKRTNNVLAEDSSNEQLSSPILFTAAAAAAAGELPLTSSSNVTVAESRQRLKRSLKQQPPIAAAAGIKREHRKVIHAMLRGQTQLACNLESNEPDDAASLVLWYKDSSMVPIFSLDARASSSLNEARHKPGPLLEGRSSLKLLWLDQTQAQADPLGTNIVATATNLPDSAAGEDTNGRSRRHATSERRRKRRSRQHTAQPEAENDNNSVPVSSALMAAAAAPATKGKQLWAQLQIESLSSEDNGVYVCRVDFRRARSRVQELALKIIVPADTPTIRDLSQSGGAAQETSGGPAARTHIIGPHNEGSRLVLECETQGGYPEPTLSWWRDGRLLDDSYEIVSGQDGLVISQVRPTPVASSSDQPLADEQEEQQFFEAQQQADGTQSSTAKTSTSSSSSSSSSSSRLIRNRLELGPLARNDLLANYSCRAPNSKLQTQPPSSFVMIDMNLRPVKVQIDNDRLPVLADRPLEIVCRAFGSRPAALISWFRGPSSNSGDKLVPQHPPQPQQQQQRVPGAGGFFSAGQIKIEESIGSESNVTSSTLTIWPRPHDSGQIVTCRAENPDMSSSSPLPADSGQTGGPAGSPQTWIEDSWKLEVHYLPRVQLQLGEKLQGQSIRESQDVYFECRVQAAPYAHEIRWWFNGKELESNQSVGVIVSNQSLVLQRVSRSQRGHYTCSAINSVGESHSSSLYLRVQFAPVCRDHHHDHDHHHHHQEAINSSSMSAEQQVQSTDLFRANSQQRFKTNYGAARMESVRVFCHVDADPADSIVYKWAFVPQSGSASASALTSQQSQEHSKKQQQQQQMVYLDSSAFTQEQDLGPLVSVATYTPRSELDYGTLLCWAQNELGQQADPCAYQLVAAEPPDPVRNCRLLNASDSQLVVACEPGYDGGIDQSFQMEVYDSRKRELVANVSSSGSGSGKNSPTVYTELISMLPNNSIEQQQGKDKDSDRDEQDDSPYSAALALTGGHQQPKQRHSSHHHQILSNNGDVKMFRHHQPATSKALNGKQQQQETLFITEPNLRPSTHYLLSIYSQNSKGASKPVAFTATTANSTFLPPDSSSARARFFSSSTSLSQSQSQTQSQFSDSSHLLSDVLALSWNPFLLVCAISVALFVLFGSLTFAMLKYVDHNESSNSNNSGQAGGQNCELALRQSAACLSKSDEQSSASGATCASASATNISSSSVGQTRRARIITLAANKTRRPSEHDTETLPNLNGQQQPKQKVSLIDSSSTYLKMKLHQMGGKKSQLKQSNSENFLDQLAATAAAATTTTTTTTSPNESAGNFQPAAFSSSSLQRPSHQMSSRRPVANFVHQQQQQQQQQPLLLNYVPGEQQQPRIEQLLISGKQYFHQTAPKQRHLQVTSQAQYAQRQHSNQRNLYAAAPPAGLSSSSSLLMKHASYDQQQHQAALCPHQQLIDGQPSGGEPQLYYCDHLQATAQNHQGNQSLAADPSLSSSSPPPPPPPSSLHLAHLRLVEMATVTAAANGQQQQHLAHIDSDSTNSTNQTLPSLFSFSHTTTTTNGSPSSGIAVATPTPTSCSAICGPLADPAHQHPNHLQHQQQYCCGTNAVGGSNSTITSSIEQANSGQQQSQHQQVHETEGGNVISVSDCLLAASSNLSSSGSGSASSAAGSQQHHHNHHQATEKISADQFDGASDGGFEENNTQQYLTYSALGLPQHHIVCRATDLNQYSVYVDHELQTDPLDANNNHQQQQIYLLQDQQSAKYPTKARVRVFSSGSGSSSAGAASGLDRSSSSGNYLRLIHPGQQQKDDSSSQQQQQQQPQLHTDV